MSSAGITQGSPACCVVISRRNALSHIAIATGAHIDTSRSEKIVIKAIADTKKNALTPDRIYKSPTRKSSFAYTGVSVKQHDYTKGTEQKELFKLEFTGQITIEYNTPAYKLSITNGTIVEQYPNYAIITGTGNGETIVTGYLYVDSMQDVTVKDPLVLQDQQTNVKTVEKLYLVGAHNVQDVAQRLYEYYKGQELQANITLNDEVVTDILSVAIGKVNTDAQIEKLTLMLGDLRIKASVTAHYRP